MLLPFIITLSEVLCKMPYLIRFLNYTTSVAKLLKLFYNNNMLVHLTSSARNLEEDLPYLRTIIETVHDQGAVLARDWIGAAINRTRKNKSETEDWADIHNESCDAIMRSDIIIIEATQYSFQQGFFTSFALSNKKPTLILSRNDLKGRSLSGMRHRLLTIKEYSSKDDLEKTVKRFIKDNTVSTKDLRFNFFIDREIYSYLREVSYETGKNKSEIIRELLEQEIGDKTSS